MMRFWWNVLVFIVVDLVSSQWTNRAFLVNHKDYFHKVITETVHKLEEKGWSSLKLNDYSVNINEQMYKWHVTGTTNYTNGFLVSIEKIDITDVAQQMTSRTVDGVVQTIANVYGKMNLRDMKIGYDVLARLGEDGEQRYTGTFVHTLARFQFSIMKNLNTKEITASHILDNFTGGQDRMVYMPASNITEVISRTYAPSQAFSSVGDWGRDHILPIILDVATNKISFPEVCLDCR